jgi:apolipoprotein N-acyltransferase
VNTTRIDPPEAPTRSAAPPHVRRWARLTGQAAACVAAGGLTSLGFPPADQPLLGVLGAASWLAVASSATTMRWGAVLGGLYGAATFAVVLSWSARFGVVAYAALVAVQALFWLPIGAVAAAGADRSGRWVARVASAWTLAEFLRARVPLGGFEWGQLGYLTHGTILRDAAAVTGVLGLTWLLAALAAAGAAVVVGLAARRRPVWSVPLAAVAVLAAAVAAGQHSWTTPAGGLRVALVQVAPVCAGPSVDCIEEGPGLLARFAQRTAALSQPVDLMVWGEGAVRAPTPAHGGQLVAQAVGGLDAPLLAGVVSPATNGRFFNRNVLYDRRGRVVTSYAKQHPVPFGEYVPLRRWLGGIADVGRLVPADLVRGTQPGLVAVSGTRLGTVSSFEVAFAREVRAAGKTTAAVTALTNQSSYGYSAVSQQLLAMVQLRAAELQRGVLLAAITGRSALIDPDGQRRVVLPLLASSDTIAQLPLRHGLTPYARAGDAPIVLAAALLLAAASLPSIRARPATRSIGWRSTCWRTPICCSLKRSLHRLLLTAILPAIQLVWAQAAHNYQNWAASLSGISLTTRACGSLTSCITAHEDRRHLNSTRDGRCCRSL